MASSSSAAIIPPNFSNLISIKLTSSNYLLWVSQITPILSCHDLLGYQLDEHQKETTILNPAFAIWNKKDQCVLSLINATLSESVLGTACLWFKNSPSSLDCPCRTNGFTFQKSCNSS